MNRPVIPVAAGCIFNDRGEVLICQRPEGKIAAGKWEFPGGKIEAGETARQALDRELHEELGLRVRTARPLIRVSHDYTDRRVILDTWRVETFDGEPQARDGQAFAWVRPDRLADHDLLAADAPIVTALKLPAHYVFTPPDSSVDAVAGMLDQLPRDALLRLRLPALSDVAYEKVATRLLPRCQVLGLRLLLDRSAQMAVDLGAAGWHATSARLCNLMQRPVSASLWFAASCHDETQTLRARELGVDFCVIGSVQATATHPGQTVLGWEGFRKMAGLCSRPAYAIGGLGPEHCETAWIFGAQGVAGIRAYWSRESSTDSGGVGSSAATR